MCTPPDAPRPAAPAPGDGAFETSRPHKRARANGAVAERNLSHVATEQVRAAARA
jgi:hypothetical protein